MVHLFFEHQRPLVTAFKYILCYGSSLGKRKEITGMEAFKYILCYGSSKVVLFLLRIINYLNTSYVMVHHIKTGGIVCPKIKFKYILCYGSSNFMSTKFKAFLKFKYILCYGSSPQTTMLKVA